MVSTSPDRVVIAPHHSTAARSPSTIGSPNLHSADAWSAKAHATYSRTSWRGRNGCEKKTAPAA